MTEQEKEYIEKTLKDYPSLKSKIKLQISRIADQLNYSVKAMNYCRVPSPTNSFYSDAESYVVNKLDKYPDLADLIAERNRIESALESLTIKEKRLVNYKYFEELPDIEVGIRMKNEDERLYGEENKQYVCDYSVPTIQRMKNHILEKLHKIGICEQ